MLKTKQRLLSTALAIAIAFTTSPFPAFGVESNNLYVSATGSDANDGSVRAPFASVETAYQAATDGSAIVLIDSINSDNRIDFTQNKTVTLTGQNGAVLTYTGTTPLHNGTQGFLTVTAGTVNIANLTVQLPQAKGTNGRVLAVAGATVTLQNGAVLANGYLAYGGGGVRVGAGGTLTMHDGATIENCYIANNTSEYGGGVQVMAGGSFLMQGGSISKNTIHTTQGYTSYGGGVAVLAGGSMYMTGGTISANTVDTAAGGLFIDPSATVRLSGNLTIQSNTAAGKNNNLYLPNKNSFGVLGAITGDVGITCGNATYEDIVGMPAIDYTIAQTDEIPFTYDGGTYDIRLKNGNLVLYWWMVDVDFSGGGITSDNAATETPKNQGYDTVLRPDAGHTLPDDITVSVGGTVLQPNVDYTYDPNTGAVHIPADKVTGDIIIDATGDALHTITVITNNVVADKTLMTVTRKDSNNITFTRAVKYDLPDTVTVIGNCTYTYQAGVLTISNATEDITVSVQGKEIYHTITLNPNGGSVSPTQVEITQSQATIGALPVPTKTGYTFIGWLDDNGNRITSDMQNNLTDNITLTASWSANTNIGYQITHYVECVDSGTNPNYTAGTTATQIIDGKTYYLYRTDAYQNGVSDREIDLHPYLLSDFSPLEIIGLTPNADNVYAVTMAADNSSVFPLYYRRTVFTVTFDPNGGDALAPNEASAKVAYGSIYGIMPTATRAGYTLIGWFTDKTGGQQRKQGDICKMEENIILYAHWQSNGNTPYTVRHLVQPLADNLPITDTAQYGLYMQETLVGTSDAAVDLYSLAIIGFMPRKDNLTSVTIGADGNTVVTLYYERIPVTISYDGNGGSSVSMRSIVYYGGTISALAPSSIRVGYNHIGWYVGKFITDRKVSIGDAINMINPDGKLSVTLYAGWAPRSYPVPLVTDGGTVSGTLTVVYDTIVGTLPTVTRTGYTFNGWKLADGTAVTSDMLVNCDTLIAVAADGTETAKTLYASWTASAPSGGGIATYTITASADTGTTISPVGKVNVASGGTQTFTISADNGYLIADVLIDGVSIGKVSTYAFSKISQNHTITVKADKILTGEHIVYLIGYPDKTVRADNSITRAEATTIFYRLLSDTARNVYETKRIAYTDAIATWCLPAVGTLSNMGILHGYADGTFRPDTPITRAEFATMAARFDHLTQGKHTFTDVPVLHWAYASIASASAKGWVGGYPDGTFRPESAITRAETAKIVNSVLSRSADQNFIAQSNKITVYTDLRTSHWAYYEMIEASNAHKYANTNEIEKWTQLVE